MSKFTRDQLKNLVKECLVEILTEGLATSPVVVESSERRPLAQPRSRPSPPPSRAMSPALNSVVFGTKQQKPAAAPRRSNPIIENIGSVTSDPIMSQIFADTAATTLQEQVQAESSRPGMVSGDELVGSPTDIFGESAQHWATLAFSDGPKRN